MTKEKYCEYCGTLMTAIPSNKRFCRASCRVRSHERSVGAEAATNKILNGIKQGLKSGDIVLRNDGVAEVPAKWLLFVGEGAGDGDKKVARYLEKEWEKIVNETKS